jgi:hypothetical protein
MTDRIETKGYAGIAEETAQKQFLPACTVSEDKGPSPEEGCEGKKENDEVPEQHFFKNRYSFGILDSRPHEGE